MAFCKNCGAEIEDSAKFCQNCGAQKEVQPQGTQSPEAQEAQAQEAQAQGNTQNTQSQGAKPQPAPAPTYSDMEPPKGSKYEVITPFNYVLYSILFGIPIVGLVFMIIWALDDTKINRRNYARSFILFYIIAICVSIMLMTLFAGLAAALRNF